MELDPATSFNAAFCHCRAYTLRRVSVDRPVCPICAKTSQTFSPKSSFADLSMWELFLVVMRIFSILNSLSNLLMLYDGDCWNIEEASTIGVFFRRSIFFVALLKVAEMYGLSLNNFLRFRISLFKHSVSHIVLARLISLVSKNGGENFLGCKGLYDWTSCILNTPESHLV